MIAEVAATACAGIFFGAALYINVAQHPAATALGGAAAVRFFGAMYARAAPMQASLALAGFFAGLAAWWTTSNEFWLFGAALLGSVIPFTLVAIMPTNDRLKDPTLDADSAEARDLLARWAHLHAVRTISSGAAFLVFVVAAAS